MRTYAELGVATPGSRLVVESAFTLCTSPVDLAMANFAMDFSPSLGPSELDDALQQVAALSNRRSSMRVFDLPGPRPQGFARSLRRAGLTLRQELCQMSAFGSPVGPQADWTECETQGEREAVATFMAGQFFRSLDAHRKRIVISATAGLGRLVYLGRADAPEAACTIVPSPGALGVYNLCVEPRSRGRGTGAAIVRRVRAMAAEDAQCVVLQCDASLTVFYKRLGFDANGWIGTYGFDLKR